MAFLTEACLTDKLALPANQNAVLNALKDCAGNAIAAGSTIVTCAELTAALAAVTGMDGVSVTGGIINASGNLILTFSDGTTKDVGVVKGADGAAGIDGIDGADGAAGIDGIDGADGVGIQSWVVNPDGSQVITLTSGTVINVAAPAAGADGKSPTSMVVTADGKNLITTYSDGTQSTVSLQPILDAIAAQLPADVFVSSVSAYNPATNIMTLNKNDGSTLDLDFTQVIADAVAGIGAATNTVSGIVQLNQGDTAGDAGNATDALTAAGLATLLNENSATPNALQTAVANALQNAIDDDAGAIAALLAALPVATDTVQGKVALNLGTTAGDDNNTVDALTSAGLAALLNSPTSNALKTAVAANTPNAAALADLAKNNPSLFEAVKGNDGTTVLFYGFKA